MSALIFHIPHASTIIPHDVRRGIAFGDAELADELRILTDHFTDQLFSKFVEAGDSVVMAPVSRLVVDVERFADDAAEPMSAVGMGAVYLCGHDKRRLRSSPVERDALMARYYKPHHAALEQAVLLHLERFGKATIVDCHSFPQMALAYEPVQGLKRPQVCIGTDPFHTSDALAAGLEAAYRAHGFSVARDTPFSGSMVPLSCYGRTKNVMSVMIELRRDIYMDEATARLKDDISVVDAANHAAVAAARMA